MNDPYKSKTLLPLIAATNIHPVAYPRFRNFGKELQLWVSQNMVTPQDGLER